MSDFPMVGVFWLIQTAAETRFLSLGVGVAEAEAYGDFLTFSPGHFDVWERWRRSKEFTRDVSILVRIDEYEDWPRGRIVFDRTSDRFVVYADRKLLTPERVRIILDRFRLDPSITTYLPDLHYSSRFTPKGGGRESAP